MFFLKKIINIGWISVCIFTLIVASYLACSLNFEVSQGLSTRVTALIILTNALITSSICIIILKNNLKKIREGWKNRAIRTIIYIFHMIFFVITGQFIIAFVQIRLFDFIYGINLIDMDEHGALFMSIIATNSIFVVISICIGITCIVLFPVNSKKY